MNKNKLKIVSMLGVFCFTSVISMTAKADSCSVLATKDKGAPLFEGVDSQACDDAAKQLLKKDTSLKLMIISDIGKENILHVATEIIKVDDDSENFCKYKAGGQFDILYTLIFDNDTQKSQGFNNGGCVFWSAANLLPQLHEGQTVKTKAVVDGFEYYSEITKILNSQK